MDYRTFSVGVVAGPEGLEVRVFDSPAGERARAPFAWPLDAAELAEVVALFEEAAGDPGPAPGPDSGRHCGPDSGRNLAPAGGDAGPPGATRRRLEDVGARLFQALFSGAVRDRLLQSLSQGLGRGERGVRIQLRLDLGDRGTAAAAALHRLPWELLRRPEGAGFLALSRRTPVVRYLEREGPAVPPAPSTLHLLAVAPEPAGLPALDLAGELRRLEASASSWWRGVRVSRLRGATLDALVEACRTGEVHALHFMGHGTFEPRSGEGALVFENERRGPDPVTGPRLARQLADFVPPLRFVFLNACRTAEAAAGAPFAGVATALAEVGVPAILAMQHPVSDRAAIEVSRAVYRELARGRPVELAVAEARLAVDRRLPGSPEWATPALFLRAPDGRLFPGASPGRRRRALAGAAGLLLAATLAVAGARLGTGVAGRAGSPPAASAAPRPAPSTPRAPAVQTLGSGETVRVPDLPGFVTVDFLSAAGQRFVRVTVGADDGAVVRRATFGAETLEMEAGGRPVAIDVLSIDWRAERVRLRVRG